MTSRDSHFSQRVASVHAALTVAIAAMLPLSKRFMPYLIALWVLVSFVRMRRPASVHGWEALLWPVLYYACVAGWINTSENQDAAWFALEVKFSLLMFPVVWWFLPTVDQRSRVNVLLALVWGCIAMVAVGLVRAGYLYLQTGDGSVFFYSNLGWFFHPTYLATYDAFALMVLGRMYIRKVYTLGNTLLHYSLVALLVLHVALLESKAGFLCIVLWLVLVGWQLLRKRQAARALVFTVSGVALLLAAVFATPTIKTKLTNVTDGARIESLLDAPPSELANSEGSTVGRLVAWRSALEIIGNEPMGVGTGDVTDRLVELYTRDGNAYARRLQLNAHNQFLQAGVAFGWIGLLVMVGFFVFGLRRAFINRDFLFGAFLGLLAFNMLFESFLEVQSGVVFVAFFYSFFIRSGRSSI